MSKESIGALWAKKITIKGEETIILKGTIDGKKVVIYKNEFKKEEKHPDYKVFWDDFVPKSNNSKPEVKTDLPF